jgi:hypothetical protein
MPEPVTKTDLLAVKQDLLSLHGVHSSLERMTLQLTVRFGVMLAVGGAALVMLLKHPLRCS